MKKVAFLILMFTVLVSLMPGLPVGATQATRDRLRELEQQRREAGRHVRDTRDLLVGTQHEMSELMAEMQRLDQQLMDAEERLEDIEISLLLTEIRIAETNSALDAAQEERDLQYEVFRARLRAMYMQGPTGWLEVLLDATSIGDFFMRLEAVQTIAQFDRDMMARLEDAEVQIAANVETLFREQLIIYDLKFLEEAVRAELQAALDEREIWLYSLAENAEQLAAVLAILEDEQRALDAEYGTYRARYEREAAAAAAQRAREAWDANLARLNNFDGQFMWPIPTHGRISSGFGMRFHPILRVNRMHTGIDVGAPTGTHLYAAADGYVRLAGWSGGYGLTVIIDHGRGPSGHMYSTLYAHNSRNHVVQGQRVNRGDLIAYVGSTGMSTGPHLHFEVRRNNVAIDPMQFFE
ncbi:MAG: peptidoglycan DD-metalloendopeptidase family protein [Defluviitaleaceae bacterium]|nr:peptidoglycan DD-metalloendopeptidase family protein [Defluviitaleaceae bacterium]